MLRTCRKYRQAPFVDSWYYDLGYSQAYTLMISLMVGIFTVQVPVINIFGALFFVLRFIFEKYQVTYIYLKEFEAKGKL